MKTFILFIGILLLLPGLCGGFFMAIAIPDVWKILSTGHGDPYGVILVALSGMGLLISCLGLYAIARSGRFSNTTSKNLLTAGLAISLITIAVVTAYFYRAEPPKNLSDSMILIAIMAIALAVVPLPIDLERRKYR